jgi:hypothetical protein
MPLPSKRTSTNRIWRTQRAQRANQLRSRAVAVSAEKNPKGKEVKLMNYAKPSISQVACALVAIQSTEKSTMGVDDPDTGFETISAYESDE